MPNRTWKPSGKHKKLFAGPWVGEFGWELFGWQARLRWLKEHVYDEVFVQCKPGHEVLYDDFAMVGGYPAEMACMHEVRDCDILGAGQLPVSYAWNWNRRKLERKGFFQQKWLQLGRKVEGLGVDVLVHARKRGWNAGRNWSVANWVGLVDRLRSQRFTVGQIGLTHQTHNLVDCVDFREQSLDNLTNIIASSRLVIGTSSGPLHLASLCRCPHVVFSDATNVMRYKDHWNPFGTDCQIVGHWQPAIPVAHEIVCRFLNG